MRTPAGVGTLDRRATQTLCLQFVVRFWTVSPMVRVSDGENMPALLGGYEVCGLQGCYSHTLGGTEARNRIEKETPEEARPP